MKKKKKKAGIAAIAIPVITAGAVAVAAAYQSGTKFEPTDSNRKLQNNQVVFKDNQDQVEHTKDDTSDNSEIWEKNEADKQNGEQENANQSDYLFQQQSHVQAVTVGVTGNTDNTSGQNSNSTTGVGDQTGGVYGITDDRSTADIILNTGGNGQGDQTNLPVGPGSNTTTGENTNTGNSGTSGKGDTSGTTTDKPSDDSGNSGSKEDPTPTPTPTPTPGGDTNDDDNTVKRPSDSAKDPEIKKEVPGGQFGIVDKTYSDSDISEAEKNDDVRITVIFSKPMDLGAVALYKSQSVTQRMIFNALVSYVTVVNEKTSSYERYIWGADALDQYVRIDALSFDGGTTWTKQFPVTIPSAIDDDIMWIKISYRTSTATNTWVTTEIPYEIETSRVYVLSEEIREAESTINADIILNDIDQYPKEGSLLNLMYYEWNYIETYDPLTELFPGWTENGKLVPWLYPVTEGRHILEPEESVPLDPDYTVQLVHQWMSDDYEVGSQYGNLCFLQTLTNVNSGAIVRMKDGTLLDRLRYDELVVPEYVQAIVPDESADLEVDYLKVPDTVLYIADGGSSLHVNRGYLIDEDNPVYQSSEEGVLMNKAGTEMLGIPYELESLTIPDTVEKVNLSSDNKIHEITLETASVDEMPDLSFENLKDCKLIVAEDILEDFLTQNNAELKKGSGVCVASEENPDVTYTMANGVILSNKGTVRRVIAKDNTSVVLPDNTKEIGEDAFVKAPGIETVIMPSGGGAVHLTEDSLADSGVKRILCYTQKQYNTAEKDLKEAGADADVQVELLATSQEGYRYALSSQGDEQQATLMEVPKDSNLTEFDGTVTAQDGTPIVLTEIGEHAFADCENLEWVTLPESVVKIGYEAFLNCTGLQGIMINAKDTITIGNHAFDGCDSIRFIASNAMTGIMEEGYAPQIKDSHYEESKTTFFYVPTNCEGYFAGCTNFTEASGVYSYLLVDIDDQGVGKMLYGADETGQPWIALRSGSKVADQVVLPFNTVEIYAYAMADTRSPSGSYTINWDELWWIQYFDISCFEDSDLGGDIELGYNSWVFDRVFAGCKSLNTVSVPGYWIYLGADVFRNCTNVTAITLGATMNDTIYYGIMSGCDNLRDVTFQSWTPPTLLVYGVNSIGYQFNYNWTQEEEAQKLRIHVPEGTEQDYIMAWRYSYAGFVQIGDTTAYDNMRMQIQMDHMDWDTWTYPTDEEVEAYLEVDLLEAENRVRTALGMELATEPTELYQYRLSYGIITLSTVPSYRTEISLDGTTLGFPYGWYLDNVGAGAFSRAKNLQKVTVPDSLVGFYENAFQGVESKDVTIEFEGVPTTIDLIGAFNGTPFSWGIDDSYVHLKVPESIEIDDVVYTEDQIIDATIAAWMYAFSGYESEADLRSAVMWDLMDFDTFEFPTDEEVEAEMNRRLLTGVNRLRSMFGLDPLDEMPDLTTVADIGGNDTADHADSMDETVNDTDMDSTDMDSTDADTDDMDTTDTESVDPDADKTMKVDVGTQAESDAEDASENTDKKVEMAPGKTSEEADEPLPKQEDIQE